MMIHRNLNRMLNRGGDAPPLHRGGSFTFLLTLILAVALLLGACQPSGAAPVEIQASQPTTLPAGGELGIGSGGGPESAPTPFPTRPLYAPGELVDYVAQTGDTLPGLALRFNTSVEEILAANTFIPANATTMPPGMPMKIPIYYLPLWGSPYRILPDSLFVNSPAQIGFSSVDFIAASSGWLGEVQVFAADANRSAGEVIDLVALRYSVSPRLLLALLEYQSGALTRPEASPDIREYPLGKRDWEYKGLYGQLIWAANLLNNGYYSFRGGRLLEIETQDGRLERFDPWINAATASLHNYFNHIHDPKQYQLDISPDGFARTYREFFGDPWTNEQAHIPGSLEQPALILPFQPGYVWAYTGGPHTAWGVGEPLAALDFAPPSVRGGCLPTDQWATAVADGLVVRSEVGTVVLDLDGDGDERTGWVIFYLHVGSEGRARLGDRLKQGDIVGHPSCEGGTSTGTHIHIARKYNGEWMLAEGMQGILAFNLEGWTAKNGSAIYEGTLVRGSQVVTACTCSNAKSFIKSDR
jgi:murein DD-endopeptidase MepM/ murein hydrolase activator NlpD